MSNRLAVLMSTLTLLALASTAMGDAIPVNDAEEAAWLHWLLPLPKRVAIDAKVVVPVTDLAVTVSEGATDVVRNAAQQLVAVIEEKAGTAPAESAQDGGFGNRHVFDHGGVALIRPDRSSRPVRSPRNHYSSPTRSARCRFVRQSSSVAAPRESRKAMPSVR